LRQQKLMMKRDVSPPVLQRKDNPDSQGKKAMLVTDRPKKCAEREAKLLKIS